MALTMQKTVPPEIKVDTSNGGSRELDISRKGRQADSPESRSPVGLALPMKLVRTRSGGNVPQATEPTRKDSPSPIDPLSQHILERTRPDSTNLTKAKSSPVIDNESPEREGYLSPTPPPRSSTEPISARSETFPSAVKDNKKNRVSFLNRFRLTKKETTEDVEEEDETYAKRPDGSDAEMFSQPIGYIPRFAEPPKYIKVKAQGKKEKDFDRVFLAQELRGLSGLELAQAGGRRINTVTKARGEAIWALEFSKDGKYLASGGEDHIIRVWEVLSTEDDRRELEREEESNCKSASCVRLSAPVFKRKPLYEYEGHTGTILDLSWSKNNFLLSSSMDKTVRLWHPSRSECLCAFKHNDHITSISFHPKDDRFFLAGSLDSKLRLWSIPDKSVAFWTKTNDLITAVAFTPDGKACIAGCLTGSVHFYETDGFRSLTQMQIRSSGRKNNKGSKITSIQAMNYPPHQLNGDVKLLITSNDSRIRIYNYRDKTLQIKFKGMENHTSQIRASLSDDARYVICGSEDKKVHIWPMDVADKDKDKKPVEFFEAQNCTVTAAVMAPTRTRQLLQVSGDPVFDICNPPPVQLVSRSESQSSDIHSAISEDHEHVPPTPSRSKPEETPAYQARAVHKNGNIIVTAGSNGRIKVFRQDCAYEKRQKVNENWDSGSTISKKVLKRTASVATRHSRHSIQDPLSFPNTERVQSWRQSLDRFSLPSNSPRVSTEMFSKHSPLSATFGRSGSPRKTMSNSKLNPKHGSISAVNTPTTSTSAVFDHSRRVPPRQNSLATSSHFERRPSEISSHDSASTPDSFVAPDGAFASIQQEQRMFTAQAANTLARQRTHDLSENSSNGASRRSSIELANGKPQQDATGHLMPRPELRSHMTNFSVLTDEMSGQTDEDSEDVKCRRCGHEEFKAKKKAGANVLVCGRCGLELI